MELELHPKLIVAGLEFCSSGHFWSSSSGKPSNSAFKLVAHFLLFMSHYTCASLGSTNKTYMKISRFNGRNIFHNLLFICPTCLLILMSHEIQFKPLHESKAANFFFFNLCFANDKINNHPLVLNFSYYN